jgi:hypothetical protein
MNPARKNKARRKEKENFIKKKEKKSTEVKGREACLPRSMVMG